MSTDEDEEDVKPEDAGEGPEPYPYGKYEGGRDDQLDRHGFGRAVLPNGDIYEGHYSHGKRHGRGLYVLKNGARYDGEWKKGLKYGTGMFIYPDGSKYVGEWKRDLKQGKGTYYYVNGDTYEGSWYKGFRHGYGTYIYKSLNVIHTGNWKDGRMEGPGIIDYGCYKYHGKFEKNLPKGPGCFVFDNNKFMQHGFYVNLRNPAFDYVGADKLALEDTNLESPEYRGNPRGIVPLWRARSVSLYNAELLPPEPLDLPIVDSQESLIDIIGYLQRFDQDGVGGKAEEEEQHLPSPVTEKGDATEEMPIPIN
ncbi:radial spoke head 1 homolog [Tribolium castaneum]|uniref:Radial spoke head 1 homolog-like Protein n=1 Tax=Tribolium castaneum TaxID=7070 RepID=D2A2H5_TRICA|nr:PREDICTED: radial spoke head 1 homolog [Tribolium castaneum]EFA02199.1 Radial spoke head 1 homolog-like Protein [Tribolium castaneum]|eukprot:XP_968127.1 PREDICTED: radial spoke head 1 homolog [Tribolium castaneum]